MNFIKRLFGSSKASVKEPQKGTTEEPLDVAALLLGGKEVDYCVCHASLSSPDQYILDLVVTNVPTSGETDTVIGLYSSVFAMKQGQHYLETTVRWAPPEIVSRIKNGEGERMTWTELKEMAKQRR